MGRAQFSGPKVLSTAVQLYRSASSFANAFDTEHEAQEVFNQLAESAGLDVQHLAGEAATRLMEWSVARQFVFKRQRRTVAVELECSLFAKRVDAPAEASDAFETLVKDDPKHALEVAKRVSKQRKTAGTNRAELEESLRAKFALELATIISEAGLPVVYQVQQFDDQQSMEENFWST